MVHIIVDKKQQWDALRVVTEEHGLSLSDVIFAISCYAEQNEQSEEFIDDLGTLSWQIPDGDETPAQAFSKAMFYESQFGPVVLQRSKYAIRMIEKM